MKSTDLGRTWTSIAGDLATNDPAWTVVQDHIDPNLLFVGTEFGLSFTVDGGQHWIKFRNGMPPIPIRDLAIQRRETDLAAASFGRGFFILDDYSPLRQLTPEVLQSEGALLASGRKARLFEELGYYRSQGDNIASSNPPFGAILSYYLREDVPAQVVLQVADGGGRMVRQLDVSAKSGLHRVAWDLRESAPPNGQAGRGAVSLGEPGPDGQPVARGGRGGRVGRGNQVKPGTYTVTLGKLSAGAVTPIGQSQKVEVVPLEASNR
jgi:hypothetical protein